MTLIAGGSALLGALSSRSASRAQERGAQAGIAEQRRQFDLTRQDQMPWLQAGQNALNNLQNPGAFQQSPGYQWALGQGMQGIERSAAARGGAASGNALKALAQFNQGLASQDFGNWWNRQAGLAGVGQAAAGNLGAVGQNSANALGMLYGNAGDARASGIMGVGNSLNNGLGAWYNNWLMRQGGSLPTQRNVPQVYEGGY
jgi:hypothetical protein